MIASVVSSLINSRRRKVIEVFSPSLKKLWKEWDLRVIILLSLTLQIVLIIMGKRRKHSHNRFLVWSAYLAADSVATFALGILANNLTDIFDDNDGCTLDANIELTAFWAPFLLLHLGGPDTITAYALEDNELWLRHFLGLIVQTSIAVYVFLMAWTGSRLSIMSILMFFVGLIKYAERTWSLRSATIENLKKRLLGRGVYYDRAKHSLSWTRGEIVYIQEGEFAGEQVRKMEEGYFVEANMTYPHEFPTVFSGSNNDYVAEKTKILAAFALQEVTMTLFLDSILSSLTRHKTYTFFGNMSFENAFKIIEIDLGFIYDLFYTKSSLLFTPYGLALRFITFILTCVTLVLFVFLDHKYRYSKVDVSITFLLLVIAVILEIYSVFVLLSSDLFVAYLHKKIPTLQIPTWLPLFKSPRWSNTIPQYCILSIPLKENSLPCHRIFELLKVHEYLPDDWYVAYEIVTEDFKRLIFQYLMGKAAGANYNRRYRISSDSASSNAREAKAGDGTIDETPNFEENIAKSILFWHIITEFWYYEDQGQMLEKKFHKQCRLIKGISGYMMYLLVVHPSMLSLGISQMSIRAEETISNVNYIIQNERVKTIAYKALLEVSSTIENEVLREAVYYLRRMRDSEKDLKEKWNELSRTWLEMLAFAASKCQGKEHAQQLRSGGQLLTHVWLLMAFLGLTDHFQRSNESNQIGRLIAK